VRARLRRHERDRTGGVGRPEFGARAVGQLDGDRQLRQRPPLATGRPHGHGATDLGRERQRLELLQHEQEHQGRDHAERFSGSLAALTSEIEDLGRAAFAPVHERMLALHADVVAGRVPGRILLVEHEPVYTAGRRTPAADLGPDIVTTERGGQITYHGPGQLVVYPIVRLPRHDLRDWLRRLEAFGVAICGAFGLHAEASVDGTGVFVAGAKVGSIGVHVKQWVNLHGIAINVAMDLQPWQRIRPCGLSPDVMTDLSRALGRAITMAEARAAAQRQVFLLTAPDVRL